MSRGLKIILAIALLGVGLWVALHLWPTTDSVEKANAQPAGGTAVRKAYHYYRTGHPRAARRVLRRTFRHWNHIPTYRTTARFTNSYPHRLAHGCRTTGWTVSSNAKFIGATLLSVTFTQRFCWGHGRITDLRPMRAAGSVHGFGEFLNWSDEGVVASAARWIRGRQGHVGARVYRFHQCTPEPFGCVFPRDKDITGAISVLYTGRSWFNQ